MKLQRVLVMILLIGLIVGAVGYCLTTGGNMPQAVPAYIGNIRTAVFHRQSCSYLPYQKNRTYFETREEAIEAGYRPCKRCEP